MRSTALCLAAILDWWKLSCTVRLQYRDRQYIIYLYDIQLKCVDKERINNRYNFISLTTEI